jgi:Protein of unknown function (DUF3617)
VVQIIRLIPGSEDGSPPRADPAPRVVALQALQSRCGGEITEQKPRKVDAVHYGSLPGDNPRHVRLIGSLADLRERHGKLAVRTTAVFILLAGIMTYPAGAEDEIKSGNWEYSVTAPDIRELPRGMQPSPDIQLGPEGLTVIRTRCITATDPFPPTPAGAPCKIDKTNLNGGMLSWSVTCTPPKITVHQEWIVHYHGETMDGQVTSRSTTPDHTPVESTTQLKGRYLGPCAVK